MKFEIPSLESEPLVYFLTHSAVFVAGLGLLFFLLGLGFGGLTWRRYKRQSRRLQEENDTLREEITALNLKLADQASKPASAPLPPPPPIVKTEVLVPVTERLPERFIAPPAPITKPLAEASPLLPLIPALPELLMPPQPFVQETPSPRFPVKPDAPPPLAAPAPPPPDEEDAVEPFSFLMDDEPEEPEEEKAPASPDNDNLDEEDDEGNGLDLLGIGSGLDFIIDPDVPAVPAPTSAPPSIILNEPSPDGDAKVAPLPPSA